MPLVMLVFPDKSPKLVNLTHDQPPEYPDGCDSLLAAVTPEGIPAMVLMPVNKLRPEKEQQSDYMAALACADGYARYGRIENLELVPYDRRDEVIGDFLTHLEDVKALVCIQAKLNGMDEEVIIGICRAAFGIAHEACCPDPVCRSDMHKKVHGSRRMN